MAKTEKIEKVAVLKERIQGSQAVLLTDYRGLSVHEATELRRSLAEGGARFAIVKNTLLKRAADEAGIEHLEALLQGPTAATFVVGDPVAAAKKVMDAARRFPALVLKGAYMEGKVLFAEEAQALATLESRDVMLSRIAGLMKGEMSRAASMFQALQGRFLAVLEAYKDKLPTGSAAPSEASDAATGDAGTPEAAPAGDATAHVAAASVSSSVAPEASEAAAASDTSSVAPEEAEVPAAETVESSEEGEE